MKTATKTASSKSASKKRGNSLMDASEKMEEAIKKTFSSVKGTISVRHLWTDESMHRFRVNWWEGSEITESKFLHVQERKNGQIKVIER